MSRGVQRVKVGNKTKRGTEDRLDNNARSLLNLDLVRHVYFSFYFMVSTFSFSTYILLRKIPLSILRFAFHSYSLSISLLSRATATKTTLLLLLNQRSAARGQRLPHASLFSMNSKTSDEYEGLIGKEQNRISLQPYVRFIDRPRSFAINAIDPLYITRLYCFSFCTFCKSSTSTVKPFINR